MDKEPRGKTVLVIGIGNQFCGDDAIGLVAARHIGELKIPGLTVVEHDGELLRLLDIWEGYDVVIAIDAIVPAGSDVRAACEESDILRLDLFDESAFEVAGKLTHQLDLIQVVRLAKQLGRSPFRMILFGVPAQRMELGMEISSKVQALIGPLAKLVLREVRAANQPL